MVSTCWEEVVVMALAMLIVARRLGRNGKHGTRERDKTR